MSEVFDAYHRWLGIAPAEQPPSHYRLLGLSPLEDDPDVIESAVDRQMAHVRHFQSGVHAHEAQQLLNEISAAKLTLLKPTNRAAYDVQSRQRRDAAHAKDAVSPRPTAPPPLPAKPATQAAPVAVPPRAVAVNRVDRSKRLPISTNLLLVGAGAGTLLLICGLAITLMKPWTGDVAINDDVAQTDHAPAPPSTTPSDEREPISPEEIDETPIGTPPRDDELDPTSDIAPPDPSDVTPETVPTPPPPTNEEVPERPDGTEVPDEDSAPPTIKEEESGDNERGDNERGDNSPPHDPIVSPAPPKKLAVPDAAARAAARERIARLFPGEEVTSRDQARNLARRLLIAAQAYRRDSSAQFVLANMARDVGANAAQVDLAFQGIDLLEANFEFDAQAVRLTTVKTALEAPLPATEKGDAMRVGNSLIDTLIADDNYDAAKGLSLKLLEVARRAKDRPTLDAIVERRKQINLYDESFQKVRHHQETLQTVPNDSDANLAIARFYAVVKDDWERALPYLVQGGGARIAQASQAEQNPPENAHSMYLVADAWWLAASTVSDETIQEAIRDRAGTWYLRCLDDLSGIEKATAQKRLAGMPKFKLPENLLQTVNLAQDTSFGAWQLDRAGLHSRTPAAALILPFDVDATDYVFQFWFSQHRANITTDMRITLPVGDTQVKALLSYENRQINPHVDFAGFVMIEEETIWKNGTAKPHPKVRDGKPRNVACRVVIAGERIQLQISLAGEIISTWEGPVAEISEITGDVPAKRICLYIGDANVLHGASLKVNSGLARPLMAE